MIDNKIKMAIATQTAKDYAICNGLTLVRVDDHQNIIPNLFYALFEDDETHLAVECNIWGNDDGRSYEIALWSK